MSGLDELRVDGIWYPPPLAPAKVDDIAACLRRAPLYASHVSAKATEPPTDYDDAVRRWPIFSPQMEPLILAPHWFEYALSFFDMAREYFGAFPRLYSFNAFFACPLVGPLYTDTQAWHRDGDDTHQFTIFMLGSDVMKAEDGEHLYQRGTHLIDDDHLGRDWRETPKDTSIIEHVLGQRGTVILVDTQGLHLGTRPMTKPRLLVWARYAVSNPPASYHWDSLKPVAKEKLGDRYPTDPQLQEAIRLVVA